MYTSIIDRVQQIWQQAKQNSPLNQKSAVSISTIDAEGFPQSRFVDLKEVDHSGFTFCTSYQSEKGKHLSQNPKVALLAWWDHIGIQIRVVGNATKISEERATEYWLTRSREARIATTAFQQSEKWDLEVTMEDHFNSSLVQSDSENPIPKPASWGGFVVAPISVEILEFKENRVHLREKYFLEGSNWKKEFLQP